MMKIYSIGYVAFTFEQFVEQLRTHRIATVVDVRSNPYSQVLPEFIKKNLEKLLPQNNINYRYLGQLLGGKGEPSYPQLMQTEKFSRGLKELENIKKRPLAIMCVEPAEERCHRQFILNALRERGHEVITILPPKKNKLAEKQSSLENYFE
ncbi:MAG: DUF488 family protein [Promethearchaeota archaeon]